MALDKVLEGVGKTVEKTKEFATKVSEAAEKTKDVAEKAEPTKQGYLPDKQQFPFVDEKPDIHETKIPYGALTENKKVLKPNLETIRNRTLESLRKENGLIRPIDDPWKQWSEDTKSVDVRDIKGDRGISEEEYIGNDKRFEGFKDADPESTRISIDPKKPELSIPDGIIHYQSGVRIERRGVEGIGLSDSDKIMIKKETGWSDNIIEHIDNMEQYEIYKNAELHVAEINGRECLIKDVKVDYVDPKTGMTNAELMRMGRSPIDYKTGEKIELHHMGQDFESPFAELCENTEHGDGNHKVLHMKTDDSWRSIPGLNYIYMNEKLDHWRTRIKEA